MATSVLEVPGVPMANGRQFESAELQTGVTPTVFTLHSFGLVLCLYVMKEMGIYTRVEPSVLHASPASAIGPSRYEKAIGTFTAIMLSELR